MSIRHRTSISGLIAATLSLVLAGQAFAADWAAPVFLHTSTDDGTWGAPTDLVTSSSAANAFYIQEDFDAPYANYDLLARRSVDGGQTWAEPVVISTDGADYYLDFADAAGLGDAVDVVWTQYIRSLDTFELLYRRSTDAGDSFAAPVRIAPLGQVRSPAVAHGPAGEVAVFWYNWGSEKAFIRMSSDGGATFAPRVTLWSGIPLYYASLAIGDGVIYAGYVYESILHMRRSFDGGATWTPDVVVFSDRGLGVASLTAEGTQAYIGFHHGRRLRQAPAFIRTDDSGDTWTSRVNLATPSACASAPFMQLRDGVVRAVFDRRTSEPCYSHVFYVESTEGTTWTPRERVSLHTGQASGVGIAGSPLVLYYEYDKSSGESSILVRTRQ